MTAPNPLTRRRMTVVGQVQGVGFRWFAKELAGQLGIVGWIRNRHDGDVELEAEAVESVLDEFAARMRTGNASARVEKVVAVTVAPQGGTSFEIRR